MSLCHDDDRNEMHVAALARRVGLGTTRSENLLSTKRRTSSTQRTLSGSWWVRQFRDVEDGARVISTEEIEREDWTLNISRYVLPPIGDGYPAAARGGSGIRASAGRGPSRRGTPAACPGRKWLAGMTRLALFDARKKNGYAETMLAKSEIQREALNLPAQERIQLVVELWDSVAPGEIPVPDWQRDLIRDRLAALEDVLPEERSVPWDAVRKRVFSDKL